MGEKKDSVKTIEIILGGRTLIPGRQPDEKFDLRENIWHHKIGEVIGDTLEIKIKRTIYWRTRVPLQDFYVDSPFDGKFNGWAVCPLI